ncbi:MAG: NUDIX domain-containing protein [Kaiparowitsia implicata GSE-PSE-MK54-09C]|nr:NUDIX domain-containing protein [Kaiparowitsia implicata GSE-PSE-MK54-09C]
MDMAEVVKDEAFGIVPIWRHLEGDRILLIQHHAGHWGFPKGHADPGETAIATACREFEEETGIREYQLIPETPSFTERYGFRNGGKRVEKSVTYFVAEVRSPDVIPQAAEIRDHAWLPYEAALERITFDQARLLLGRVRDCLAGQ